MVNICSHCPARYAQLMLCWYMKQMVTVLHSILPFLLLKALYLTVSL